MELCPRRAIGPMRRVQPLLDEARAPYLRGRWPAELNDWFIQSSMAN